MPEAEVTQRKIAKDKAADGEDAELNEDLSFASKMESEKTQNRIASLFAPEGEQKKGEEENLDNPYMSVNEGLTTDTAMTTDMEGNTESVAAATGAAGSESTD